MNLYKAAQKSGALSEELNPFKERETKAAIKETIVAPVDTAPNKPVDTVDTASAVDTAPVDRKAYQREWQRKRRAAQKGGA